jgi:hypothetical protein
VYKLVCKERPKSCLHDLSELDTTEHDGQHRLLVRVKVVPLKGRCPLPPTGRRHVRQRQMLPSRRPAPAVVVEGASLLRLEMFEAVTSAFTAVIGPIPGGLYVAGAYTTYPLGGAQN